MPLEKWHPAFEQIRTQPGSIGGRTMMNEVFETFEDKDGNFVRDFQTAGFDARVFELYLHAYFADGGYTIDTSHQRPDFMVERDGVRVAIEATTSSRPDPFVVEELLEPTSDEIARKQRDEMPVRLGSPLFSKLQKRYWELPHVAGLPFVLAIEAFHDTTSLFYPGGVLANYLYGLEHFPTFTEDGQLLIGTTPIDSHERPGKTPIPSNFFAQPGAEHVSAIVFSNSGTYSKFNRMGFLAGHQRATSRSSARGRAGIPIRTRQPPCRSGTRSDSDRRWRRGARGWRSSTTRTRSSRSLGSSSGTPRTPY